MDTRVKLCQTLIKDQSALYDKLLTFRTDAAQPMDLLIALDSYIEAKFMVLSYDKDHPLKKKG